MRKKKIYLDTTVISHLRHDDRPDWMADTLELWDILKTGKTERLPGTEAYRIVCIIGGNTVY